MGRGYQGGGGRREAEGIETRQNGNRIRIRRIRGHYKGGKRAKKLQLGLDKKEAKDYKGQDIEREWGRHKQ